MCLVDDWFCVALYAVQVVTALIQSKADPNPLADHRTQMTALPVVAAQDRLPLLSLLLQNGAELRTETASGAGR